MTNRFSRLGLLLLIAALAAAIVGVMASQQGLRGGAWPELGLDTLQSIEVSTQAEQYTLVNEQGGWVVRLAGAEADALPPPADPARIEALLAAIARNRPNQTLDAAQAGDLAATGLDKPQLRIRLRPVAKGAGDIVLSLGRETPTGAAVYAQTSLAPESVVLFDSSILHVLGKPAENYFDPRLLDVHAEDVQRLVLNSASGVQWELERKDDSFVFLKPEAMQNTSLTATEVRLYLHNLTAITADTLYSRPDRQPAGRPVASIDISTQKSQTPMRLELFAPLDSEMVYGRSTRLPAGFQLDREKAKSLLRQAFDMQWRGVINFDSARVESARVFSVTGNQTMVVEKTATGWEDRERSRKLPGIDMALWRLKELRFEAEPVSRLSYPAAQRLLLDLQTKDGHVLASFTFFTDPRLPADQCWLKVGSEEMYYPVSNQILEDVQGFLPPRPMTTP